MSSFLEDHGLWEEARQLQHFEKKETEAAKHDGTAEFDEALKLGEVALAEVSVASSPRPGQKRKEWRKPLHSRLVDLSKVELASTAAKEAAPAVFAAMEGEPLPSDAAVVVCEIQALLAELRARRAQIASPPVANPFVQALNALLSHGVSSRRDSRGAEELRALNAKAETADEAALRKLSSRSREFAPALATLRSAAVDKGIFGHLAEKLDEVEDDEESDDDDDPDREPEGAQLDDMDVALEPETVSEPPPVKPAKPVQAAVFGLWTQALESEEEAEPTLPDPQPTLSVLSQGRKRLRKKTPQPMEQPSGKSRRAMKCAA